MVNGFVWFFNNILTCVQYVSNKPNTIKVIDYYNKIALINVLRSRFLVTIILFHRFLQLTLSNSGNCHSFRLSTTFRIVKDVQICQSQSDLSKSIRFDKVDQICQSRSDLSKWVLKICQSCCSGHKGKT